MVIKSNNSKKVKENKEDEQTSQHEQLLEKREIVGGFDEDSELNNNSISPQQIEKIENKNQLMKPCKIRDEVTFGLT